MQDGLVAAEPSDSVSALERFRTLWINVSEQFDVLIRRRASSISDGSSMLAATHENQLSPVHSLSRKGFLAVADGNHSSKAARIRAAADPVG